MSNIEVDVLKVYLFYLVNSPELYAFTADKEMKDGFLYQRNPSSFRVVKTKMDELEFSMMAYQNRSRMLCKMPLNSNLHDSYTIISTYDEEAKLMQRCDEIDNQIQELHERLSKLPWKKKKYKKSIDYLCSTSVYKKNDDNTKDLYSTINLMSVFISLFSNTFEVPQDD